MFYRSIFVFFLWISSAQALVPVESLVLGDFSESYSESESDPLNYVFSKDKELKTSSSAHKRELALYRGVYEEGKNLANFCKAPHETHYASVWQKIQVMRSMMSEIQYIGLDLTARALPQYAKAMEFTHDEYVNLVDNLVGNYCSANLSVISKKELRHNMILKFDRENSFSLPNVSHNPLFPDNLDSYLPPKTGLEQEFKYTIRLFQSICSWGGDPTNPVLMVPIVKNPALMSFFIRQLDNRAIEWKELDNSLFIKEDKNTVQVWCENLVCRKLSRDNFYSKVYYSVGGTNLSEDLKNLYCEEWRLMDYNTKDTDERLSKMMKGTSFDEQNFIASQFIALITGVPDFLLRGDNFKRGEDVLRSNIDHTWNKWAKTQSETLNRELYFEEPLTLELVDRDQYFDFRHPVFKVAFDVNLGEFDRINQRLGKVNVGFNLLIQKSFLHYYRDALKNLPPDNVEEKERLLKRFKLQMSKDLENARDKFIVPPWKGDLESIIARELTEQLLLVADKNFTIDKTGVLPINIELHYGLFALKYIEHQKTMQNARLKIKASNTP